jgi:hypothetical protein
VAHMACGGGAEVAHRSWVNRWLWRSKGGGVSSYEFGASWRIYFAYLGLVSVKAGDRVLPSSSLDDGVQGPRCSSGDE